MMKTKSIALVTLLSFLSACGQPVISHPQNASQKKKMSEFDYDIQYNAPMDEFEVREILNNDAKDIPSDRALEAVLWQDAKITASKIELSRFQKTFDREQATYDRENNVYRFKKIGLAAISLPTLVYAIPFMKQADDLTSARKLISREYQKMIYQTADQIAEAAPSEHLLKQFEQEKAKAIRSTGQNHKAIREAIDSSHAAQLHAKAKLQARYADEYLDLMNGKKTRGKFGRQFGKIYKSLQNKIQRNFGVKVLDRTALMNIAKKTAHPKVKSRNKRILLMGLFVAATVAGITLLNSDFVEDHEDSLGIQEVTLDLMHEEFEKIEKQIKKSEFVLLSLMKKYGITYTHVTNYVGELEQKGEETAEDTP